MKNSFYVFAVILLLLLGCMLMSCGTGITDPSNGIEKMTPGAMAQDEKPPQPPPDPKPPTNPNIN